MKKMVSVVCGALLLGSASGAFGAEDCSLRRSNARLGMLNMPCQELRAFSRKVVLAMTCKQALADYDEKVKALSTANSCDEQKATMFAVTDDSPLTNAQRVDMKERIANMSCAELAAAIRREKPPSCQQVRTMELQNQDRASCQQLRTEWIAVIDSGSCAQLFPHSYR